MRRMKLVLIAFALCCAGWSMPAAADETTPPSPCEALMRADFSSATAGAAVEVVAAQAARIDGIETCRLEGSIDADIGFEIRLPRSGWNGKFLMQGCRAFCGVLMTDEANDALKRGYAVASTDMGHAGSIADVTWAYNNPKAETDFAARATVLTAQLTEAVIDAFYGDAAAYSYYRGCSTGERKVLTLAQRHPSAFGGLISGAPVQFRAGMLNLLNMGTVNDGAAGDDVLDGAALTVLHAHALVSCDPADGKADGIIGDPLSCQIDVAELTCDGTGDAPCLTPRQVDAAERIYAGYRNLAGEQLAPAPLPGSEFNWEAGILPQENGRTFYTMFAEDILRYMAFENDPGPDYSWRSFNAERDLPRMNAMAELMEADDPDLTAFANLGHKLILYHGWQDDSVAPLNTVAYAEAVAAEMGPDALAAFLRLYMIPGMNHCGGGPGYGDVDWLTALEAWVERAEAPAGLDGKAWPAGDPAGRATHLPYPLGGG